MMLGVGMIGDGMLGDEEERDRIKMRGFDADTIVCEMIVCN